MKKRIFALLTAVVLLAALTGCASSAANAPQEETTAGEMTIVSTSTAICQILDLLNYDSVIGVPETSGELPQRYGDLPTVGSPMNPDLEIVKSLKPDLVLSPQTLEASLAESYRAAGITSAFLDLSSVEGMYGAIASLGQFLDREEEAEKLVADYEAYMEAYHNGVEENPDILLLMAFPDGFYLVATENSYVGNLVKLAGGRNVYGADYEGDENGFVSINPEDMVQKDPDMILVFAHYAEADAFAYMEKEFAETAAWQYYDAVKDGAIGYLPSKYFNMSATLSWTEALDYLAPILHGDSR